MDANQMMEFLASVSREQAAAAAALMVATLEVNERVGRVDAVALVCGLNNQRRTVFAIALASSGAVPLISLGTNDAERERDGAIDEAFLRERAERRSFPLGTVLAEPEGPNTKIQVWNLLSAIGMMSERPGFSSAGRDVAARRVFQTALRGIKRVAIVADAWHLPRVCATYARQVLRGIQNGSVDKAASEIQIVPISCACPFDGPLGSASAEHQATGFENVARAAFSEAGRNVGYDDVGDARDLYELLRLNGQWQQMID